MDRLYLLQVNVPVYTYDALFIPYTGPALFENLDDAHPNF